MTQALKVNFETFFSTAASFIQYPIHANFLGERKAKYKELKKREEDMQGTLL